MAKPTGPLLSLGASGTIAKTLTFATWKGRPYAKHHVSGKDPRTAGQASARDTFRTGDRIWTPSPALLKAPWDRAAQGQVKSGYNVWVGRFVRDNLGQTDLLQITFSPGAAGGLATNSIIVTPGADSITIDFSNPTPPIGWTLQSAIAAAIRDGDPTTTTFFDVTAGQDAIAQAQVVLPDLVPGATYIVGAWLRWAKSDGSLAYGPSLPAQAVVVSLPYSANAVHFDGTNDFLSRGADMTGNANGKLGIMSFWLNLTTSDGVKYKYSAQGNFVTALRDAPDKIVFAGFDPGATQRVRLKTSTSYTEFSGWNHFLAAWDVGNNQGFLYVNDVDDLDGPSKIISDAALDYTRTEHAIGAQFDGAQKMNADIADLYINFAEFLDISVLANRRKFIDAAGKPVDLGATGALPTGTAPIAYFSGPTAAWHTNKGPGGGFTENGALTTAATSPSD